MRGVLTLGRFCFKPQLDVQQRWNFTIQVNSKLKVQLQLISDNFAHDCNMNVELNVTPCTLLSPLRLNAWYSAWTVRVYMMVCTPFNSH